MPRAQSFIVEALVILQFIATIRVDGRWKERDELAFALIHALNLAEGGRAIKDRRKGGLVLVRALYVDGALRPRAVQATSS